MLWLLHYIYQYKDHLGNNRVNYSDKDHDGQIDVLRNNTSDLDGDGDYAHEILQENSYYPFGLEHKGYNTQITGQEHQYKYNGTELTEELGLNWYEMPLRSYDPAIARWNRIDPVVHHGLSPYNAFDNNPVFYADPSGGNSQTHYMDNEIFNEGRHVGVQERRNREVMGGHGYGNIEAYDFGTNVAAALAFLGGGDNNSKKSETKSCCDGYFLDLKTGKLAFQNAGVSTYGKLYIGTESATQEELLDMLNGLGFDTSYGKKKGDRINYIYADTERAFNNFINEHHKEQAWEGLLLFLDMSLIFEANAAFSSGKDLPVNKRFSYTPRYKEIVYGYYGIGANGVEYVGISNNPAIRFKAHGKATDGKQFLDFSRQRMFNSRLDARIWEQQQINDFGLRNLLNRRNEIRRSLWSQYGIKD